MQDAIVVQVDGHEDFLDSLQQLQVAAEANSPTKNLDGSVAECTCIFKLVIMTLKNV